LAEFHTDWWAPVPCDPLWLDVVLDVPDVAGAAAALGAAPTASVTPIPALANPIARSGRTGMPIAFLTLTSKAQRRNDFNQVTQNNDS
jgi:hypothetical protein